MPATKTLYTEQLRIDGDGFEIRDDDVTITTEDTDEGPHTTVTLKHSFFDRHVCNLQRRLKAAEDENARLRNAATEGHTLKTAFLCVDGDLDLWGKHTGDPHQDNLNAAFRREDSKGDNDLLLLTHKQASEMARDGSYRQTPVSIQEMATAYLRERQAKREGEQAAPKPTDGRIPVEGLFLAVASDKQTARAPIGDPHGSIFTENHAETVLWSRTAFDAAGFSSTVAVPVADVIAAYFQKRNAKPQEPATLNADKIFVVIDQDGDSLDSDGFYTNHVHLLTQKQAAHALSRERQYNPQRTPFRQINLGGILKPALKLLRRDLNEEE